MFRVTRVNPVENRPADIARGHHYHAQDGIDLSEAARPALKLLSIYRLAVPKAYCVRNLSGAPSQHKFRPAG
jgi:hypothetical protein